MSNDIYSELKRTHDSCDYKRTHGAIRQTAVEMGTYLADTTNGIRAVTGDSCLCIETAANLGILCDDLGRA